MAIPPTLPVARTTPKGAKSLRAGNPWLYRTELAAPPDVTGPGAVVMVVDSQGNPIGQALYARRSPLALRLLTRTPPRELQVNDAFFRKRLEAALARRSSLSKRDGLRLVHGEADLLPGLFVDRYGKGLTLQTLSEGMDARKESLAKMLVELTGATHVVCRDDASGRDFEGLPRETRLLHGQGESRFTYHEGDNRFDVDLMGDMKTGAFLDQVDNHLRAGELARGEALDLFSYHGGFALSLARSCTSVIAVEQDEKAAARIGDNARANNRTNVTVEHANAFDVLKRFDSQSRRFDFIVLDPPGLAKRREGLETALRAYHELNLRALRCLKPDGVLVTCSCSGKLDRAGFEEMLLGAAADAKRPVQILERRGAGLDHPVLAGLPETEYLKALYVRAL
ncbi:class I SAM-dependent rRNA methyltransferase [Myxococcus sp. MISCRS1]|uniref:class I SAM-dependent rRNA methyltransferase n=1 Tax=Myxococcus TaxID=32 RepID=UPI001CBE2F00|nr:MULTISPECIES: class I SAM-dependent rRNA methyltransferase [unclassified Myxococcus]MBZ4400514.1 class I SAM-dependent rRNA methyltransferase [Myxococcus sp. AS-1-15]MBZ4412912.1 class I SAM-dependent rRNA methyltransferase [Myxococcus sp. XM-1-1-1]MCY0997258.1 class I SAM-dependent rRNA methyltransferase [Myxococcus sp. MISCRS1]